MTRRFTPVWGNAKLPKAANRPGAASAGADAESGDGGGDAVRRGLFALDAMLKRGLIDAAEHAERRAALLNQKRD